MSPPPSINGSEESPVPGRFCLPLDFADDEEEADGVNLNGGVDGLLGVGLFAGE